MYGYLIFVTIFLSILLVIVHRLVQIAEAILNLLHIIEDMDKQIHKLKRHKKKYLIILAGNQGSYFKTINFLQENSLLGALFSFILYHIEMFYQWKY